MDIAHVRGSEDEDGKDGDWYGDRADAEAVPSLRAEGGYIEDGDFYLCPV